MQRLRISLRSALACATAAAVAPTSLPVFAQGFEKVNTMVVSVQTLFITISVAIVSIAIMWAGFKMIFQGARLVDVANVLIGATFIGGATAFAGYLVS